MRRFHQGTSRSGIALFYAGFVLAAICVRRNFINVAGYHNYPVEETAIISNHTTRRRPRGAFVIKVARAQHAAKTICSLSHFFHSVPQYPIRIFADYNCSDETKEQLKAVSGGADVQVIVDATEQWKKLPPLLTQSQREQVEANCKNLTTPLIAKCTKLQVPLGYVYMGYWRYMLMADEPALQQFEYFVSLDADAYLTKPMPDPFLILAENRLTGFFNIEAFQGYYIKRGIQEAAASVFSLDERQDRFLSSPTYSWFANGTWGGERLRKPSIWGCFYGGRLDFFRNDRYKEFASLMVPSTYIYRTDEQAVIGVAWSLLAAGEKIWYLPKRGIYMGIFHHGWIDDSVLYTKQEENRTVVMNDTLESWSGLGFIEPPVNDLLQLGTYHDLLGMKDHDDVAKMCKAACNKDCN